MFDEILFAYSSLIDNMGFPDYTQAYEVSFNPDGTYVVPCDSLLIGGWCGHVKSLDEYLCSGYLVINGISTASLYSRLGISVKGSTSGDSHLPLFVKQGDVLSMQFSSSSYHHNFSISFTAIPLVR